MDQTHSGIGDGVWDIGESKIDDEAIAFLVLQLLKTLLPFSSIATTD
jgi:hypothetical protein